MPTVGGTENLLMAASLAEGETVLENAAREPEIVDLANFLRACGAKIEGHGTSVIHIQGVSSLHDGEYPVMACSPAWPSRFINCPKATAIPCPRARTACPTQALVFPLPSPVYTRIITSKPPASARRRRGTGPPFPADGPHIRSA